MGILAPGTTPTAVPPATIPGDDSARRDFVAGASAAQRSSAVDWLNNLPTGATPPAAASTASPQATPQKDPSLPLLSGVESQAGQPTERSLPDYLRGLVQEQPGYRYGAFVPMKTDLKTGDVSLGPGMFAPIVKGIANLLDATKADPETQKQLMADPDTVSTLAMLAGSGDLKIPGGAASPALEAAAGSAKAEAAAGEAVAGETAGAATPVDNAADSAPAAAETPAAAAYTFKETDVEDSNGKTVPGLSTSINDGKGYLDLAIGDGRLYPSMVDNGEKWGTSSNGKVADAYEAAIAEAQRRGLNFTSDDSVTTEAARVYDSLTKRGYDVEKNPSAKLMEPPDVVTPRWMTSDGSPVFSVAPKPAEVPEAAAARPAARGINPAATPEEPLPKQEPFAFPSATEGETVSPSPREQDMAARFLAGETGTSPVQASLQGLSREPDLNVTIDRLASFVPRDDIKPDDVLRMNAYAMGVQPEDAVNGAAIRGALPTDEQIGAHAMLLNSAGEAFRAAAAKAATTNDPADIAEATRGISVMSRLIDTWTQAGTEQGRAFRARQLAWDTRSDQVRAFQTIMANVGPDNVEEIIRKVATLDDPAKVSPFVASMKWMSSREGLLYGYYNALLSNPATVVKKVASDASVQMMEIASRYAAEKMGSGAVAPGEAAASLYGYTGAFKDALKAAWLGIKSGESHFASEYQGFDGQQRTRLSALAAGHAAPEAGDAPTLSGFRLLRAAMPTSWIGAADDFGKVMAYRAEVRPLVLRKAVSEGLAGDALQQRMGDLLNAIPQDIHEQAVTAALRNTFTEPLTGTAEKIAAVADSLNIPVGRYQLPVGRVILPFIRTPANILGMAYRYSPLSQAFQSAEIKAALARGGAERDMVMARAGLGTGLAAVTGLLALSGKITGNGPSSPDLHRAWLAAGNEPNSVRIGDRWYGFNKLEPLGMTMAAVADSVDIMKFAPKEDADQIAGSLVFGLGGALLSKTYMSGAAQFLDALNHPDQQAGRYTDDLLTSFGVPQGAAGLARAIDPWRRQHTNLLQSIESRLPGLSQKLPPQRTLWGDPIRWEEAFMPPLSGTGAARMLSPVPMSAPDGSAEPIDRWIWDNRNAFPRGPQGQLGLEKLGQVQSYDRPGNRSVSAQVQLTPVQWDRLQVLAGNGLKMDIDGVKLGAKDLLNGLVEGNAPQGLQAEWNGMPPSRRAVFVTSMVNRFREAAKRDLLREYPDIVDTLRAGWASRASALSGSPTPGAGQASGGASASAPAADIGAQLRRVLGAPGGGASTTIKQPRIGG